MHINKIMTDNKLFVVENGYNTCYIDSLLMALFYTPSNIYFSMLDQDPKNMNFLYLQEMIKTNFVEPVRNDISVISDTVNEIRNYSFINGWKMDTPDELLDQQDVSEYYTFLLQNLNDQTIDVERVTITEGIQSKDDFGTTEKLPFITVCVSEFDCETNVKSLLLTWMNDNPVDVLRETIDNNEKVQKNIKGLNTYKLCNIPQVVPIFINRFHTNTSNKLNTKVDIKRKIKLIPDSDIRWVIHSVICHTGDTIKCGHYYAILINNNKWYMFDDMAVPCLAEINMSDSDLINKIQRECVFLFYKYSD